MRMQLPTYDSYLEEQHMGLQMKPSYFLFQCLNLLPKISQLPICEIHQQSCILVCFRQNHVFFTPIYEMKESILFQQAFFHHIQTFFVERSDISPNHHLVMIYFLRYKKQNLHYCILFS